MKFIHKLALLLVCLLPVVAVGETRKVAVVIGNNAGAADRNSLHYAEVDAGKLAGTLVELGGIAADNLFLLQGRDLNALRGALDLAKSRVVDWHKSSDARVVLMFYFSGHSDGTAIEIGRERLTFSELRKWLSSTGAEVRVAIVDSCRSGALLATKGGRPGPAFQIRLSDDLASRGEALLTSSAADELALESKEIRGSFFTHHFVSGLRGAADSSGDGNVTLAEAYQYAFSHTVSATAGTLIGPQHPAYDYRLAGQGELVLTELSKPDAAIGLPEGFDRILVIQLLRDQVLAELPMGATNQIAVPPGDYVVRAWKNGKVLTARVTVRQSELRMVRLAELEPAAPNFTANKGNDPNLPATENLPLPPPSPPNLVINATSRPRNEPQFSMGVGVQRAASDPATLLGALNMSLRSSKLHGYTFSFNLGIGRGPNYTEAALLFLGGYRWSLERGIFRGRIGVEAGGGVVIQSVDLNFSLTAPISTGLPIYAGGLVVVAPWVGASFRVLPRLWLDLEVHVPLGGIRENNTFQFSCLPYSTAGFTVQL